MAGGRRLSTRGTPAHRYRPSGKRTKTLRYTLSLFEPGRQELPDFPLIYVRSDGADTVRSALGSIEVVSVLTPQDTLSDINDIRPPVKLAWTLRDSAPYLIALGALILASAIFYLLWRRYRKAKGLIPVWSPPPPPRNESALSRLDDLRLKKLWQNGYFKEYYVELTDILKIYNRRAVRDQCTGDDHRRAP